MVYRKKQYLQDNLPDNTRADYLKSGSRTNFGRFIYGAGKNPQKDNQRDFIQQPTYDPNLTDENLAQLYTRRKRSNSLGINAINNENFVNHYNFAIASSNEIRKSPGSFTKKYAAMKKQQSGRQDFSRSRFYDKKEKIKLIKEFESLGASIGMFCK